MSRILKLAEVSASLCRLLRPRGMGAEKRSGLNVLLWWIGVSSFIEACFISVGQGDNVKRAFGGSSLGLISCRAGDTSGLLTLLFQSNVALFDQCYVWRCGPVLDRWPFLHCFSVDILWFMHWAGSLISWEQCVLLNGRLVWKICSNCIDLHRKTHSHDFASWIL